MQNQNEPQDIRTQPVAGDQPVEPSKKKKRGMPTAIKVIILIVVILIALFVVLYLTAWIAGFDSVASLLRTLGADISDVGNTMQSNSPPSIT